MSDLEVTVNEAKGAIEDLAREAQAAYDSGYDDGTAEAWAEYKSDPSKPFKDDLRARYDYLKHGGEWQRAEVNEPEQYLAGFLDAMTLLGVKP